MRKRSDQQQKYYFSDRLKGQLAQIPHYPLTVVEAPSGFGKTTAIREYLKENLPRGACEYWYTCLGESAFTAWMGICDLLSNANGKVADNLRTLKMPTLDTLFYMATYLRDVPCHTETYLVVDNYQLVDCDIPHELISVFAMHGNPNLHMIFITQQVKAEQQLTLHNSNIYSINSSAFFFDKEGTANLFRMEGINLADAEAEKIYMTTEGWISAIRLQIINYKESGLLDYNADIEHLVETAIWNRLTPEERDFLLSVSVIESFTTRQAAIMMGKESLTESIKDLLKSNEFIRYIPDQYQYIIHSILRDYLLSRFYHDQLPDDQNQIFRKAGYAYAAISEYCPAAHFFYKVKDFDAILSLPFSCEYFDNYKDKYEPEFIEAVIRECPEEIMRKYPFVLIVLGYQTLSCGQIAVYQKICRLLCSMIQDGKDFSQGELRKLKGEYTLLASIGDFNDIAKIKESQKAAWEILGQPSKIIRNSTMWGYSTPSVLSIFWREAGKLEDTMQQINEMSGVYRKLTQGQGAGTKHMIRAEAMLMRGEEEEAEILCHKALYDARNYQQTGVCLCAELTLARIAILRGDVESYFAAIKNIQGYGKENPKPYVLRIVEHCMSIISLLLGIKDYVAPWLYDMESIKKVLPAPVVPLAQILHLRLLLMDKRYNAFYGVCQLALDASRDSSGSIQYKMPQVYQLIFLAVAKRNSGKYLEAQTHLKEALGIALPDQIYLPFAEQECMADFFSELTISSFDAAEIAGGTPLTQAQENHAAAPAGDGSGDSAADQRGGNSLAVFMALCKRQQQGVSVIKKAILQDKSPLTPREREIAQLAKDRFSAKEIADKLYISEMTVRATLRSVYSKLDIHSKMELSLKEF